MIQFHWGRRVRARLDWCGKTVEVLVSLRVTWAIFYVASYSVIATRMETVHLPDMKSLADGVLKKARTHPDQVLFHQKKDGRWVVSFLSNYFNDWIELLLNHVGVELHMGAIRDYGQTGCCRVNQIGIAAPSEHLYLIKYANGSI